MQQPTPEQMRRMANKQAAPLVEQLKSDPANAKLLAQIGDIYYDTQQYPTAIDYYQRTLEVTRALGDEPNKPNALFNLGVVQWQGKMDIKGALATWQRLLDTNPNYDGRAKVLELMKQVKKHAGLTQAQGKAASE